MCTCWGGDVFNMKVGGLLQFVSVVSSHACAVHGVAMGYKYMGCMYGVSMGFQWVTSTWCVRGLTWVEDFIGSLGYHRGFMDIIQWSQRMVIHIDAGVGVRLMPGIVCH